MRPPRELRHVDMTTAQGQQEANRLANKHCQEIVNRIGRVIAQEIVPWADYFRSIGVDATPLSRTLGEALRNAADLADPPL